MVPLIIFNVLVFLLIVYVIITQLVQPLLQGKKIFPIFRKSSSLRKEVEATKEIVEELEDQTVHLTELQILTKKKLDLEAKIETLKGDNDVE